MLIPLSILWICLVLDSLKFSTKVLQDSRPGASIQEDASVPIPTSYKHYMAVVASKIPTVTYLAQKTLCQLAFALKPLRAREVSFAISLGLEEADEKLAKSLDGANLAKCRSGLVTFSSKSDDLNLIRYRAKGCSCQELANSLAHKHLAKICLLLLTIMARQKDSSGTRLNEGSTMSGEEGLFAYDQRKYLVHSFQALTLSQHNGPYISTDDVGLLASGSSSSKKT